MKSKFLKKLFFSRKQYEKNVNYKFKIRLKIRKIDLRDHGRKILVLMTEGSNKVNDLNSLVFFCPEAINHL